MENKLSHVISRPSFGEGSSFRTKIFFLDIVPNDIIGATKLPRTKAILGCFFKFLMDDDNRKMKNSNPVALATSYAASIAAKLTIPVLKSVWKHHFGIRCIFGQEWEGSNVIDKHIMIIEDKNIGRKISSVWEQWKNLERKSRRPDRSETPSFRMQVDKFKMLLEQPFNIARKDAGIKMKEAGIKNYQEEMIHLNNQLDVRQIGNCGGRDFLQKRRDIRVNDEAIKAVMKSNKGNEKDKDLIERTVGLGEQETVVTKKRKVDVEEEFQVSVVQKKRKIDILGPISLTADAQGLSIRGRIAIAASVTNSLGIDIKETNINNSSAWRQGKKQRLKVAKQVKEDFTIPPKVSLHWDGSTLNIRGNLKSNRVCVYVSGADFAKTRKLLGIPETESGKGEVEAELVKQVCGEWCIRDEIVCIVFDTTESKSSGEVGACM